MREKKPTFASIASWRSRPQRTSIPALRSISMPRPDTWGLGSSTAATTRPTRASMSAVAHGGVRPKCEQGSRLT